jgi:RNA polymerase sigma-70 factor, ECF subfamily
VGTGTAVADNGFVVEAVAADPRCVPRDAALIAQSGERPDAFSVIFDRHFAAVQRYLARRVGKARADDLAAQTFVVAFERRRVFDREATSARPWLFGIANNLMRNEVRAERRLLRALARLDAASAEDLADEAERALSRADAASALAEIAGALAALDDDQRDVLLLYAWGELTYEEIAQALAIPTGTVRSRLSRARSTLQTALAHATDSRTSKEEL